MDMQLDYEGLQFLANNEGLVDPLTREVSDKHLKRREMAEDGVNNWVVVGLSQGRYNALVSFVYSIGVTAFKRSTLLKRVNQGKFDAAAKEFEKWIFADGEKSPLLVERRTKERELFLTPAQSHPPEHLDISPQSSNSLRSEVPA